MGDSLDYSNKKFYKLVFKYRKALEVVAPKTEKEGLKDFPFGACGATADLLGNYLRDFGYDGFEIASGVNDQGFSHAWLEDDGWIVDITGAQFKTIRKPFLITTDRSFHKDFVGFDGVCPDFHEVPDLDECSDYLDLEKVQQLVVKELKKGFIKRTLGLLGL